MKANEGLEILLAGSYFHCPKTGTDMEAIMPQVMHMTHWVSVKEYAKASGIQLRSAYLRIKRGVVSHTEVAGIAVIDIQLSPPARNLRKDAPQAPSFIWHPQLPPRSELMAAWDYCDRHKMRGHSFDRAILQGKVRACIIADSLFVERDLDPTPFKRKPTPPRVKRKYRRW